jgi:hypothetical protein
MGRPRWGARCNGDATIAAEWIMDKPARPQPKRAVAPQFSDAAPPLTSRWNGIGPACAHPAGRV